MSNRAKNIELKSEHIERFWKNVKIGSDGECWPWLGQVKPNGYGRFDVWQSGNIAKYNAHRVAYYLWHQDIPIALDIDHECHNTESNCNKTWVCPHRRCCNPRHLKAKCRSDNLKAGRQHIREKPLPSHCKFGDEYTLENTWYSQDGRRSCKICNNRRQKETQLRRRLGLSKPQSYLGRPKRDI